MIDYIKILINDCDINRLINSPHLDFKGEYSESTGEIGQTLKAVYHYCTITIFQSGSVSFTGSIHKLYNSLNNVFAPNHNPKKEYNGYNGNLFTYADILEVREHLIVLFDCVPQQMVFQNIEFGINTTPNFKPKLFLDGLLYHQNKGFDVRQNGHYKQVEHVQYWLKIYNKSRQYGLNVDTLRVEIKIKKSEYLIKWIGVETFADITPDTLEKAKNTLLDAFSKIVYYDYTIRKEDLKERTKNALTKYENPNYWLNELKPHRRSKPRKRLAEIINKHSDNLYKKIEEDIDQKCSMINLLSGVTNDRLFNSKLGVTNDRLFDEVKKSMGVTNDSLNIGSMVTHQPFLPTPKKEVKKCLVTGVDISMQKEDSFLLSHTGIKWYYQNDKKTFDEVVKKYLSEKWTGSTLKTQIRELAHNIRNYQNNRKLRQQKIYPENQYRLFDILGSSNMV